MQIYTALAVSLCALAVFSLFHVLLVVREAQLVERAWAPRGCRGVPNRVGSYKTFRGNFRGGKAALPMGSFTVVALLVGSIDVAVTLQASTCTCTCTRTRASMSMSISMSMSTSMCRDVRPSLCF